MLGSHVAAVRQKLELESSEGSVGRLTGGGLIALARDTGSGWELVSGLHVASSCDLELPYTMADGFLE